MTISRNVTFPSKIQLVSNFKLNFALCWVHPTWLCNLQGMEWPQICQMQKHCSFLSLSWFYPCLFYVYANPNRAPGLILPTESETHWNALEREKSRGGKSEMYWFVSCLFALRPVGSGRNQCERLEIILYVSNLNLMCKS